MSGLRDRKKQETRQRISDTATGLFIERGFDAVTIAEIAAAASVSEKTVYNYFPTKESLVFDQADVLLETVTTAVRERPRGATPTSAFVTALKQESAHFLDEHVTDELGPEGVEMIAAFGEMVSSTPALRAAWGEHRHTMVASITEVLADEFGVDPRDPEPAVAARGLASLVELYYDSQLRHVTDGVPTSELRAAVGADLDRGARLLDTGFWAIHLMLEGRKTKDQIRDAAAAAEQARRQVVNALRDAKAAWREIREEARAAGREMREEARAAGRDMREEARATQRQHREAQRKHLEQVREAQRKHLAQARENGRRRTDRG